MKNNSTRQNCSLNTDVQIRKYPCTYRAMLAICSDLDSTLDRHVYLEIMRFLNTNEMTSMGPGVGLEVGNSIHFRAIPPQFSYWDTDEAGRKMVRALIHSGHIDCLHSFGECIYTRGETKQALDELMQHDCKLEVWVDHGGAVTNFGTDIMQGHGDEVGHPAYHADLTIPYGIKYIWRGRTTSITGQDTSPGLGGIFNRNHPIFSGRTLLKEITKRRLAKIGNKKYAMHLMNQVLHPSVLRDGRSVYEFMRCNPYWRGVGYGDQGRHIGDVLTEDFLNRLIDRRGTCVLYTHLGKVDDPKIPFNKKACGAFRRLAKKFHEGRILVTTTRRLLAYCHAIREVHYESHEVDGTLYIDIDTQSSKGPVGELSNSDLDGLTFYVPELKKIQMTINNEEVTDFKYNGPDYTGQSSVSLPWRLLKFPQV